MYVQDAHWQTIIGQSRFSSQLEQSIDHHHIRRKKRRSTANSSHLDFVVTGLGKAGKGAHETCRTGRWKHIRTSRENQGLPRMGVHKKRLV